MDRQTPPSPANGTGMVGLPAAAINGMPMPAGHQADLNIVYSMVDELSRLLAENQAKTDYILESVGRVRQRAASQGLSNEEIIFQVANELNETVPNLEAENAQLRRRLANAEYDANENMKVLRKYATQMGKMLEALHAFKERTTMDFCAWHRSYRQQLADARAETAFYRADIDARIAAAHRGAEALRKFKAAWSADAEIVELKTQITEERQKARFWKRMALKELPDDDPTFSDDDDLIDPVEKQRIKDREARKLAEIRAREGDGRGSDDIFNQ